MDNLRSHVSSVWDGIIEEEEVCVATKGIKLPAAITSIELIINITLSNNKEKYQEHLATLAKKDNNKVISYTRSAGVILVNGKTSEHFLDFVPVPEQRSCPYGRNNLAVVRVKLADGTSIVFDEDRTVKLWEEITGADISNINFRVKLDLPKMSSEVLRRELGNGGINAISIKFNSNSMNFEMYKDSYRSDKDSEGLSHWYFHPVEADVCYLGSTVGVSNLIVGTTITPESIIIHTPMDKYTAAKKLLAKEAAEGGKRDAMGLNMNQRSKFRRYGKVPKGYVVVNGELVPEGSVYTTNGHVKKDPIDVPNIDNIFG